jgi:hypothetical protein
MTSPSAYYLVPVPVSGTFMPLTLRIALFAPALVGLKMTLTVQVAPAVNLAGQVLVCSN